MFFCQGSDRPLDFGYLEDAALFLILMLSFWQPFLVWVAIHRKQCGAILSTVGISLVLNGSVLQPSLAQVVSDGTFSTTVITGDTLNFTIENGDIAGPNLFHSFKEFSVPTNGSAHFNNGIDVDTIVTRVTGGQISSIDGLLSANGTADLFLLNANGIVLGPNAQLNLGGSFIGSTAETLLFEDGTAFSAINTTAPPLLTISTPTGLQLGDRSGGITVHGEGHRLTGGLFLPLFHNDTPTGLSVAPGETLGLISQEIQVTGGILRGEGQHIQLSGVATGIVELDRQAQPWTFDHSRVEQFGNIQLSKQALVDSSGNMTSQIQLDGQTIRLDEGSVILIQNEGTQASGAIIVNAASSIDIVDAVRNGPDQSTTFGTVTGVVPSRLSTEALSSGQGGDIVVTSTDLSFANGGTIFARSYTDAPTGHINVDVAQTIEIQGYTLLNSESTSGIFAATFDSGNAEEIMISAQSLHLSDGAGIISFNLGSGQGGDVEINVVDDLVIRGINSETLSSTNISSSAFRTGGGGNVTVNVARLILLDAASLSTATFAEGDASQLTVNASESIQLRGYRSEIDLETSIVSGAYILNSILNEVLDLTAPPTGESGSILIFTPELVIAEGASIGVSNEGLGDSGSITIAASQVMLEGSSIAATSHSGRGGRIKLMIQDELALMNGGFITTETLGSGLDTLSNVDGGDITIQADRLRLVDDSQIRANSLGGQGGNIALSLNHDLHLTRSAITSTTASDDGGNITVNAGGILSLFDQSLISTTAGQAEAGGNGGNITLSVPFIVSRIEGNNDIAANAFIGNGGNIDISTQGLFGIAFQPQPTINSDITASSQFGVSGTVAITEVNTDPDSGLVELPTRLVDSSDQIAEGCAFTRGNTFITTGRGGMAPAPTSLMVGDRPWLDMRDLSAFLDASDYRVTVPTQQTMMTEPMQEATGLAIAPDGTPQLITARSNSLALISAHPSCAS